MTGLFCASCGEPIHGTVIRQSTQGCVCVTCVLEALQSAKDRVAELTDELIELRAENVEAVATIAELKGMLGCSGAAH